MKMFNLLKPLFLYAFLSLCSTACDDGHVPMPNPEAACRLTYINMPDEIPEGTHSYYTGIEYNEKGYVTRIYNTRDTDDDEIKFTYNTDNQVIRAESYTGELILYDTFEYTNGLLTTITEYTGSGDEDEFARSSFTINKYNSKKQLIESKSDDGSLISTYTYDNKGNLTKTEGFRNGKLYQRTTYENYDSNPTPYSGVKGLPGFYFESYNKNNPRKSTKTEDSNKDGTIDPGESEVVTTYTYTYNSNGYPSEITEMRGKYTISNKYDYACK